jgi:dolichol-phosphate mannosyltransferase
MPDAALTLVVPTYNERGRIGTLLERLFAACDREGIPLDVVVVDDNSADGTGDVAEEWARRRPVRVIRRAGKLGLGSAVLDGFGVSRTEIVGVMDADLSHPPELLPELFRLITHRRLDLVLASRYVPGGGTASWPLRRLLMSRLACVLARPVTPVRDAMSGFFVLRRERLAGFRTSVRGFKIGLELLGRLRLRALAEVPYVFRDRTDGVSKMNVVEGLGFLRQLLGLYWHALSGAQQAPIYLVSPSAGSRPAYRPDCAPTPRPTVTGRPAA